MEQSSRVVFVTGGAYGIGRATVRCFVSRGDAIVIADIDELRGKALEAELRSEGKQAFFVLTNVRDESAVQRSIERTLTEWGGWTCSSTTRASRSIAVLTSSL